MHEDGHLLENIRTGDDAGFERLYQKYSAPLYRTVVAITRDHAAAEDILQESFVRLFKHAITLDRERPVLPWLHRVAINLSYNWVMRDRLRFVSLDHLLECWNLRLTGKVELEKEYDARARAGAVHSAVDKLDFDQRVVIVLFYLQGFSVAEISETLAVPVGTAKSRLHYARKALERMLLADALFRGEVAFEPL
jgi:RNA polymerase sigma-70 factor (ECF subfamily)